MPSRPSGLSLAELTRYGRQLSLPDVGPGGQRALKSSSVLVVGVGGLGTAAAAHLAAAGVGTLGLADGDAVERSNLQRQLLFAESDLGRNKAEAAKGRLAQVNPLCRVVAHPRRLDRTNALRLVRGYDVVLDSTDDLPSRYLLSDACVLAGRPDVYASALGLDGVTTVFHPPRGPCLRCIRPAPPPPGTAETCEESGVLGVVPGIMGAVQALQAVSLIVWGSSPLVGRLLVFGGRDSSFSELKVRRDPECAACGRRPTVRRLADYDRLCGAGGLPAESLISPEELRRSMARGPAPLLLDVREPYEAAVCHLPGSTLIPLGELGRRMGELDRARAIVVYCHHGRRSATATRMLRAAGFADVRNLEGGVEAWALRVDPTMPRY